MAYISFQPKDYFNTKLYTGNSTDNHAITGVGFAPDFTWIKNRTQANFDHMLFDALRGTGSLRENLRSNTTSASDADASNLKTLDSDGFTLGTGGYVNHASTFVSWNWKANGAGSANTDGSINSTVSANTTSGFSIVKYVGSGSNATVGHGLSTAPTAIFCKNLDSGSEQWINYDVSSGATKYYHLNMSNGTSVGSTIWNNTAPTTSVFSVGTVANCNSSGVNYIAYCFSNITGFSKVGGYSGNGNANGAFIYTGFKPAFVIVKQTNANGESWKMYDNKRPGYNLVNNWLEPDDSQAEGTGSNQIDMVSNGFKARATNTAMNASGSTYIYLAFAEEPLVSSNGVAATAR